MTIFLVATVVWLLVLVFAFALCKAAKDPEPEEQAAAIWGSGRPSDDVLKGPNVTAITGDPFDELDAIVFDFPPRSRAGTGGSPPAPPSVPAPPSAA